MLPAPLRPLLRPRYYIWVAFIIMFVWSSFYFKRQAKEGKLKDIAKKVTEKVIYVGGMRVGKEWVDVPDGIGLPHGLDIEVDMQTGKKRVRVSDQQQPGGGDEKHDVVPVSPVKDETEEISPMGGQKKWERVYDSQHKTMIDAMLEDLDSPNGQTVLEALNFLEERVGKVDIGAGLVRSPNFRFLLNLLEDTRNPKRRRLAATILFSALQNNPAAAEGILETDAVKILIGRLHVESNQIVTRKILSSLIAIVRGDEKSKKALSQFSEHQAVLALSQVSMSLLEDEHVMDRVLVLLVELATTHASSFKQYQEAVNLMENIVKNLKKPYNDWMTHAFKPFCKAAPPALATKPSLRKFCHELNEAKETVQE